MGSLELECLRTRGICKHRRQQGRASTLHLVRCCAPLSALIPVLLVHGKSRTAPGRFPEYPSGSSLKPHALLPPSCPPACLPTHFDALLLSGVGGTSRLGVAVSRRALEATPSSEN